LRTKNWGGPSPSGRISPRQGGRCGNTKRFILTILSLVIIPCPGPHPSRSAPRRPHPQPSSLPPADVFGLGGFPDSPRPPPLGAERGKETDILKKRETKIRRHKFWGGVPSLRIPPRPPPPGKGSGVEGRRRPLGAPAPTGGPLPHAGAFTIHRCRLLSHIGNSCFGVAMFLVIRFDVRFLYLAFCAFFFCYPFSNFFAKGIVRFLVGKGHGRAPRAAPPGGGGEQCRRTQCPRLGS